jgi:hypothetical protein
MQTRSHYTSSGLRRLPTLDPEAATSRWFEGLKVDLLAPEGLALVCGTCPVEAGSVLAGARRGGAVLGLGFDAGLGHDAELGEE